MIDVRLVDSDGTPTPSSTPESSDAEEEDDDADSGQGMTEIRYVPDDKSKLEEMFTVNTESHRYTSLQFFRHYWRPSLFAVQKNTPKFIIRLFAILSRNYGFI